MESEHSAPIDVAGPGQRPVEPEHPMIVDGQVVPGDTDLMVRCLLEELLQSGMSRRDVAALAIDPNYQALYAARAALGAARFDEILNDCAARVGTLRVRIHESFLPPGEGAFVPLPPREGAGGGSDTSRSDPHPTLPLRGGGIASFLPPPREGAEGGSFGGRSAPHCTFSPRAGRAEMVALSINGRPYAACEGGGL